MILLSVQHLRKHYGPDPVLDGLTLDVRPGERIGLVGPNGTGKTTLLRILAGREEPDAGSCEVHPSVALGYLEQRPLFEPGRTLWEEARSALAELIALQREGVDVAHALANTSDEAEHRRLAARFDRVQQELHHRDAYNVDHKIGRVLDGLGFGEEVRDQPVESLSGGEQNRLMLAKLLLAEPGLMLLDEPSNHLDLEGTRWLEEHLAGCPAAMILVSHDRSFLDTVTNRTVELWHGTVDSYAGNYSAYRRQKEERLVVQRRAFEKWQLEIDKAKEFIRRNAYGQKHAQAEDRRKKLAELQEAPVDPPREITAPPMGFPAAARTGDIVIRAEGLAKAFDRPLFEDVSLDVLRGQRWAVLGPNGSGKTTLVRCLLGQIPPDAGTAILGQGVRVGYFDQHLKALDDDARVVDAIRPERGDLEEPGRRDLLARFGVAGDTALQTVARLSGGERCRAALAMLAAAEANVLVLDEPTNHLDLWALEALEQSLCRFDGTVLMVSHDRTLINRVADHLIVFEPNRVRVVEGNYDTYQHLVRQGIAGSPAAAPSQEAAPDRKPPPAEEPSAATPRKKRRFPYRKVEDLERDITARETRIEELHATLADPSTHRNGDRARQVKAQIAQEQETLQALYEHWEEAVELNW